MNRREITAAAIAGTAGIGLGLWIGFRQMSTLVVGTIAQYDAIGRVKARREAPARPVRPARQRPAGRDPIDPQTESRASCLCGQRVVKGAARVPCPVHGASAFDSIVAEVPAIDPEDLQDLEV